MIIVKVSWEIEQNLIKTDEREILSVKQQYGFGFKNQFAENYGFSMQKKISQLYLFGGRFHKSPHICGAGGGQNIQILWNQSNVSNGF